MPHAKKPTPEDCIRIVARVAFNENGRRVGEHHHKARIPDAMIELCFDLSEQGWGSRRIAKHIGAPRSTVQDILACRTRSQIAIREKTVVVIKKVKPE